MQNGELQAQDDGGAPIAPGWNTLPSPLRELAAHIYSASAPPQAPRWLDIGAQDPAAVRSVMATAGTGGSLRVVPCDAAATANLSTAVAQAQRRSPRRPNPPAVTVYQAADRTDSATRDFLSSDESADASWSVLRVPANDSTECRVVDVWKATGALLTATPPAAPDVIVVLPESPPDMDALLAVPAKLFRTVMQSRDRYTGTCVADLLSGPPHTPLPLRTTQPHGKCAGGFIFLSHALIEREYAVSGGVVPARLESWPNSDHIEYLLRNAAAPRNTDVPTDNLAERMAAWFVES